MTQKDDDALRAVQALITEREALSQQIKRQADLIMLLRRQLDDARKDVRAAQDAGRLPVGERRWMFGPTDTTQPHPEWEQCAQLGCVPAMTYSDTPRLRPHPKQDACSLCECVPYTPDGR